MLAAGTTQKAACGGVVHAEIITIVATAKKFADYIAACERHQRIHGNEIFAWDSETSKSSFRTDISILGKYASRIRGEEDEIYRSKSARRFDLTACDNT